MKIYEQFFLAALMTLLSPVVAAETVNGKSSGRTMITACTNAKHDATRLCDSLKVSRFNQCECEQVDLSNGDKFECSVDAVCEAEKKSDEASMSTQGDEVGDGAYDVRKSMRSTVSRSFGTSVP